MRVSGIFIQENPAEKVKNDDFLGQKPLKPVWKQSIFLDLSGLSNYRFRELCMRSPPFNP